MGVDWVARLLVYIYIVLCKSVVSEGRVNIELANQKLAKHNMQKKMMLVVNKPYSVHDNMNSVHYCKDGHFQLISTYRAAFLST